MRILQVCQYYYPWVKTSSTGKVAYKVSKYLSRQGVKVNLVTTDYHSDIKIDGCLKIFTEKGFKIYMFHVPRMLDKLNLCYSRCFNQLEKFIDNYDIIHVHEYLTPLNLFIIHLASKYGIPYILQPHGNVSFVYQFRDAAFCYRILRITLDKIMGFKILNSASAILVVSDQEKELLEFLGIDVAKVFKIYNAIDLDELKYRSNEFSLRNRLRIGRDEFVILYIGRKVPVKRLDLLIKALKKLLKEHGINRRIRLIIAGPNGGKYEQYLQSLVMGLGLEKNVIFLGPLYGDQKAAAFKSADIFALTSTYESFPMVMLEAFLYKTPVLITKAGIATEKDFSDNVILVNPAADEIAQKIYEIIKEEYDLREMTEKSYRFLVNNLIYEKVVPQIVQVYKTVLENR